MRKRAWFWVLLFGAGPALYGCTASLSGALEAFHDGRLPAAASELRLLEPQLARQSPREQAHYALYRGLTELGLGNAGVAERWLHVAWQADAADCRCFDAAEHGALLSAWRSLGRLPGEGGGG
ncbi:MAG TPA: hypothetical protein VGQ57_03550 [Polyangiaceae bacterium]|jgi:hypothetical protein|nr:hypothetical protein [Polyangiaceae bacterium]